MTSAQWPSLCSPATFRVVPGAVVSTLLGEAMIAHPPSLWQTRLSALLATESEQSALEVAVATVAELVDGPAVGILKGRAEHLSSVAAHDQDRYVAPLFVEALWMADPRLASARQRSQVLFENREVVSILLRDDHKLIGAICALAGANRIATESPRIAVLELAFVRTIQRIRRLAETRLLYEISLRLGSTLDLPQLLQEVLSLTAATFAAAASRIFLFDERAGDLVMTGGLSSTSDTTTLRLPLEGTIAGWVVTHGAGLIRNEPHDDPPIVAKEEIGVAQGKVICVPLKNAERTMGALMLVNQRDDPDFLDEDLRLLTTIAGTISMMVANARLYQRAIRDALTGAYNRGAFDNTLHECWNVWQTAGQGFALILLDLDDFKQINDRFGHSAGDLVLQSVTKLLWEALREEDGIFRYGGEEFAVLLSDVTDLKIVISIAERLRAALDRDLTINNLVNVKLSASLGVALHPLHGATSRRALLDMADDAAYQAKRSGKNQVVVAPRPDPR
ncbi:MAG TPA: sensor domain-containing diguanylate cyclase [Roseiflexaceae bacterium]|nr:sensor domain-containing diguanylate cyclase [Roseiflexaceae bacterium]